jgi:hypothetical protein
MLYILTIKKSPIYANGTFFLLNFSNLLFFSSQISSASRAAIHPVPAAVIA